MKRNLLAAVVLLLAAGTVGAGAQTEPPARELEVVVRSDFVGPNIAFPDGKSPGKT